MDRTVARMNIGRFRKLLAEERDSRKRETIRLLLEEEERKLAAQTQGHQGGGPSVLVTKSRIGRHAHSSRRKWLRSAWFRLLCTVAQ